MKEWLRNANGWQRLWVVGLTLLIFYWILIFPFTQANGVVLATRIYLGMSDPKCSHYMTDKIESLNAPESITSPCYYLWSHRTYVDTVIDPYTADVLSRENKTKWLTELAIWNAIGAIFAFILSGLIYALGTTVRWVVAGF
jgi:hypothetical protein